MKPSDNNIVGGFICKNQDILSMKFLDNPVSNVEKRI